ncbi:helix-turn-helix domain-containing protein [Kribbella qitaiheensis]|uniref:Helix-turn-helix domain-containing protein n=1 Tax=Kribbella qitaiheensis TaxID=1544730 RepID=A0A7G6X9H9_9ACTN|nr:helix-turn-helix domain-containing protein [Kribbella qitaiheensis]
MSTVAELIREWRVEAGLTQEALADQAGLSVEGIRALEGGRRLRPRPATIEQLSAALSLADQEMQQLQLLARPSTVSVDHRPAARGRGRRRPDRAGAGCRSCRRRAVWRVAAGSPDRWKLSGRTSGRVRRGAGEGARQRRSPVGRPVGRRQGSPGQHQALGGRTGRGSAAAGTDGSPGFHGDFRPAGHRVLAADSGRGPRHRAPRGRGRDRAPGRRPPAGDARAAPVPVARSGPGRRQGDGRDGAGGVWRTGCSRPGSRCVSGLALADRRVVRAW